METLLQGTDRGGAADVTAGHEGAAILLKKIEKRKGLRYNKVIR